MTRSPWNLRVRRARAFTLVELLIVVAMIGVMAALALVGYRKYLHTAQGSEAKAVIQAIRGGEEAYKSEMLQYLNVSSSLADYYPNGSPNDTRWAWARPGDARYDAGWKLLNVNPDGPVRFGYACRAGIAPTNPLETFSAFSPSPALPTVPSGTAWYEIQAINDHDGNGTYAVFGSSSLGSEIMSQNEQE